MRIKIKTLEGNRMKADTDRLDAVIQWNSPDESKKFFLLRTGQFEYRQLSVPEAQFLLMYLSKSKKTARDLSIKEVDDVVAKAKDIKSEDLVVLKGGEDGLVEETLEQSLRDLGEAVGESEGDSEQGGIRDSENNHGQ